MQILKSIDLYRLEGEEWSVRFDFFFFEFSHYLNLIWDSFILNIMEKSSPAPEKNLAETPNAKVEKDDRFEFK